MIARATGRAAARRRWVDNALRFVAAAPAGYATASLWAAALARVLPMTPTDAVFTAGLVAPPLVAVAAMRSYAARSGLRGLAGVLLAGGIAAAIAGAAGRP